MGALLPERRYGRLMDEVVLGTLGHDGWRDLRAHLAGCATCRERYNRVVRAERILRGGPASSMVPSPEELARIGASLFAPPSLGERWRRWFASPARSGAVLALAGGLAALLLVVRPLGHPGADPRGVDRLAGEAELQARGGGPERAAGLRAFCIQGAEPGAPVAALDESTGVGRCATSALLKLAVANPGDYRYVFLVGVDGAGAMKWYQPRPPAEASVRAPDGAAETPLGPAVRLGVNHLPGPLRIFALFSDEPIASSEVAAAVAALNERGGRPTDAERLPLPRGDLLQRSLRIQLY